MISTIIWPSNLYNFQAMFSHDSLTEGRTSEVTIDDVSPEVMKKFLDFVIGKDIKFDNSKEAGEMLMAADKYDVQGLFNFCEQEVGNKQSDT